MSAIIEILKIEFYLPLVEALNLIPLFGNQVNGISMSMYLASFLTLAFFFFVVIAPIWFVYKAIKGVMKW